MNTQSPIVRGWSGSRVAIFILRLAVGTVYVYAGIVKMRDPQPFADSIASFHLLPASLNNLVALGLPPLEILSGLALVLGGAMRRAGAFCVLVLTGIFLLALASAQARGLAVDCGCFGPTNSLDVLAPTRDLRLAIGRDLVLAVVAGFLYREAVRATRRPTPTAR